MRLPRKRFWLLPLAVLLVAGAALYPRWRAASDRGGQLPAEPFRIAGNFYYVGANDVSAYLLTSPEGHVLIDGGYPATPALIVASIRQLGFDIRDVKILLNSEPHFDHAGGLAELQRLSGAEVYASDASAEVLASGGLKDPSPLVPGQWLLAALRLITYDPVRVDHRVQDGDTVRLGPLRLVAHVTGGHTKGCTSWAVTVREGDRDLNVLSACSLLLSPYLHFTPPERYPGVRADVEHTYQVLRSLPVDIWVTSHARLWGRYRKFQARATAADSVAPFIDPDGYRAYVDSGEARYRRLLAEQEGGS